MNEESRSKNSTQSSGYIAAISPGDETATHKVQPLVEAWHTSYRESWPIAPHHGSSGLQLTLYVYGHIGVVGTIV